MCEWAKVYTSGWESWIQSSEVLLTLSTPSWGCGKLHRENYFALRASVAELHNLVVAWLEGESSGTPGALDTIIIPRS